MKALVTGANGFLGSYLVKELVERGYEVTGMTRRPDDGLRSLGVANAIGDVRNPDAVEAACRDQQIIYHTAAISGIWGSWKHFHGTNTVGTRNVVEAALAEKSVERLVYTSSPSVTFNGDHQINENESVPYAKTFLCNYPKSKALAEKYVLDADDAKDLMTCALRPHLIWGPGDRHLVPRLIQRARDKKLRRVGDGSNLIDTTYVENAALAHVQAGEALKPGSPVCGSAYFISQGDPVNCWQWINEVLQMAGLPRVRQKISFYWAWRLGYALEVWHDIWDKDSEPRMTRFLAAQLSKSHYFDISRAKRDFGYYPRVSSTEGMKRLAASMGMGEEIDREPENAESSGL